MTITYVYWATCFLIVFAMAIRTLWNLLDPIFGLYRHYKGDLYLGLCRSWESDNDAQRVRRVLYWSLKDWQLDDRTETEFLFNGYVGPPLPVIKDDDLCLSCGHPASAHRYSNCVAGGPLAYCACATWPAARLPGFRGDELKLRFHRVFPPWQPRVSKGGT